MADSVTAAVSVAISGAESESVAVAESVAEPGAVADRPPYFRVTADAGPIRSMG